MDLEETSKRDQGRAEKGQGGDKLEIEEDRRLDRWDVW